MNHGTFLYFKNQEDYRLHITNASHTLKKLVVPSTLQQLAPTLIIPPPLHHGHLSWEIPLVILHGSQMMSCMIGSPGGQTLRSPYL